MGFQLLPEGVGRDFPLLGLCSGVPEEIGVRVGTVELRVD